MTAMTELEMDVRENRARLTAAQRAALPDSAFAYIDADGNRHFPIHDAAHVRNALARIAQGAKFGAEALPKVKAAAKKFGIDTSQSTSQDKAAFELRKRRRASMVRQSERRGMQVEMRALPNGTGGTNFEFNGYASVFDTPFEMWDRWGEPYTEVVKPGAFSRSLSRPDLDVPFLIGHDDKRLALARTRNGTMHLSQDSRGLLVHAVLDGRRTDARDLAYAVERGDNDEMSVGFVTLGQRWSDDYETRSMLDLDIHRGDVSSVPLGAVPETAGAMVSFPTETLSRRAAEARASMNAAATPTHPDRFDPDQDGDDDSTWMSDTDNDFWNADGTAHRPMTTSPAHTHPHDDGQGGTHHHAHSHTGDGIHLHDHPHSPELGQATASGRPLDRRANPVDQDMGDAADYSEQGQVKRCGNGDCAHMGEMYPAAAKVCAYCGDALVRIDEQGVPGMEEESGAQAALAYRRNKLELLGLMKRTEVA